MANRGRRRSSGSAASPIAINRWSEARVHARVSRSPGRVPESVAIITKSHTVTRDIDLLRALAAHRRAQVMLSITTLDDHLAGAMEPRASRPARRLDAVRELSAAGIPPASWSRRSFPASPITKCRPSQGRRRAGALTAGRTVVRLPHGVKELFADWPAAHIPDRKEKILNRLRAVRHGKLNESTFGARMTGHGPFAEAIHQVFELHRRRLGLTKRIENLDRGVPPPVRPATVRCST